MPKGMSEAEEKLLWIKRWNTIKNYLNDQIAAPDNNDCCYGTLEQVRWLVNSLENITELGEDLIKKEKPNEDYNVDKLFDN